MLKPHKEVVIDGTQIAGKNVMVIGANAGIGFAKCQYLIQNKVSKLIMGCRSLEKANEAKKELDKIIPDSADISIEVMKIDLSSFKSIREFAEYWNQKAERLDILFNNAGMIGPNADLAISEDGFEMTYQCNVLGQLLLTELLLDSLSLSSSPRIIFTSSSACRFTSIPDPPSPNPHTPLRDVWIVKKHVLNSFAIYCDSKLLLTMICKDLQESLLKHPKESYRKIFVANYHPGFVKTTISDKEHYNLSKLITIPTNFLVNAFAIDSHQGARPGLYLSTCDIANIPKGSFWNESAEFEDVSKQNENAKLRRLYFERCIKDSQIKGDSLPLKPSDEM